MKKTIKSPIVFIFIILASVSLAFAGYRLVKKPQSQLKEEISREIKIIDGNICQVASGETKILVNKDDFKSESIIEFIEVKVSPDKSKMCFLGRTIVPIWLFYSNIDGSEAAKVGVAKNCVWSPDSQKIAYNNHTTDVSPVNVLTYDLSSGKITNLTKVVQQGSVLRAYQLPQWSEDNNKITSQFTALDFDEPTKKIEGTSVIDLTTYEVIDN